MLKRIYAKLWIKFKSVDLFKWTPAFLTFTSWRTLFFNSVARKSKPHSKRHFANLCYGANRCAMRLLLRWWCPFAYNAGKAPTVQLFMASDLMLIYRCFFFCSFSVSSALSLSLTLGIRWIQFSPFFECTKVQYFCPLFLLGSRVFHENDSHANYLMSSV